MINNQLCDGCTFGSKCVAKAKLKPFVAGAKVDFGVTLDFKSCVDYKALPVADTEETDEEE